MSDGPASPEPGPRPRDVSEVSPPPSRLRQVLVILCLVPIAVLLSPVILFVVCAALVRK